jgi:hypothetical protein
MINITLKAKHYRLIIQLLKEIVVQDVFRMVREIHDHVLTTLGDDEDVEISVTAEEIAYVYPRISALSEGEVAEINKEMDYMLRPQLEAGIAANNAEWIEIATQITEHKTRMAQARQARIDEGKSFLEQWS